VCPCALATRKPMTVLYGRMLLQCAVRATANAICFSRFPTQKVEQTTVASHLVVHDEGFLEANELSPLHV